MAPFTKLSLSKILVLSDAKAREDYFSQQANFASLEGRRDDHAEFSTSLIVNCLKFEKLNLIQLRAATAYHGFVLVSFAYSPIIYHSCFRVLKCA